MSFATIRIGKWDEKTRSWYIRQYFKMWGVPRPVKNAIEQQQQKMLNI